MAVRYPAPEKYRRHGSPPRGIGGLVGIALLAWAVWAWIWGGTAAPEIGAPPLDSGKEEVSPTVNRKASRMDDARGEKGGALSFYRELPRRRVVLPVEPLLSVAHGGEGSPATGFRGE